MSGAIYHAKGGAFTGGFVVGFLLGPLGLLLAILINPPARATEDLSAKRRCPHCEALLPMDSVVCTNCRRTLNPWAFQHGLWWKEEDGIRYWLDEKTGGWIRYERPDDTSSGDPRERTS